MKPIVHLPALPISKFCLLSFVYLLGHWEPAFAQPVLRPESHLWHPDGPINAVVQAGTTAYFGGSFTYVGPQSGALGLVSAADTTPATVPRLNGTVLAIIDDGNGGHFVGGTFTDERSNLKNLVHLDAAGNLDGSFAPNPNDTVRALALRDGNLYVGGNFNTIAGSTGNTRRFLTAIDPVTGHLNTWNAFPNNQVLAIVAAADAVYAGGTFTTIGGQSRTRLAKLNPTTGTALPWNPGVTGNQVAAMALSGNILYVGGDFTLVGGKPRNRIAAVDTTVDANGSTGWNPNSNGRISALEISGSTVLVSGAFTGIGNLARTNLAGLDANTGQATAGLAILPNAPIESIQLIDGGLYLAGSFSTINGSPRRGLARVDPLTGALSDWAPPLSLLAPTTAPAVYAVAAAGPQVMFGGNFLSSGGVIRSNLAALDLVSGRATSWNPAANNQVYSLAVGPSVIYAGGIFTQVGGAARARLAGLNLTDGSATAFVANVTATGNNGINAIAAAGDRVYVGGLFTAINATNRANFARLAAGDGFVNKDFIPNPNAAVRALVYDGSNLFAGGDFTTIGASNRTHLAAINLETGRSSSFNARINSGGFVRALSFVDGQLYVAGDFSSIGGLSRRKLARVSPSNGDASPTWNPDIGLVDGVQTFALAGSRHVAYVGGNFRSAGGELRDYLAGVDYATATATVWNPGVTVGSGLEVRSLHYGSTHLLMGGEFRTVSGTSQPYLAAFSLRPSVPVSLMSRTGGNVSFTIFDGDGPGTEVRLQSSPDVLPSTWTTIQTTPIIGTGTVFEDPDTLSNPRRFFRLLVTP